MEEKAPREAAEPDLVFTVSVALAPPDAGVFDVGEKENVASEGRPKTLSVSAGIVPVDPATRVKVTVYVALVPRRTVKPGVIVMV